MTAPANPFETAPANPFASFFTEYADQSASAGEDAAFVIPAADELAQLSDDDLAALVEAAQEHFNDLYGDGTGLTSDELDVLATLTEGIEALSREAAERAEAAAARDAAAAELAARVRPAEPVEPDATDADAAAEEDGEAAPAEPAVEPVAAAAETEDLTAEPASVTASGRELRVSLSAIRSRQSLRGRPASQPTEEPEGIRSVLVAAGEGLGVPVGTGMDWEDTARALERRLGTYNVSAYQFAAQHNKPLREQHALAAIKRSIPAELTISSSDPSHIDEVFSRAADERRLPQGSLVAAGGWCAPSETMYDLLGEIETRDGLLSIPEIGVARGGVQFTKGPTFADIYGENIGWSITEDDDIGGRYAPGEVVTTWPGAVAVSEGDVYLVNGAYLHVTTAGTAAASAPTPPTTIGGTVTSGTAELTRRETSNIVGSKPCYRVECPEFEEYRLDVDGLCVQSGLLQQRGYPEVLARTLRGVLVAHDHRLNGKLIAQMEAGSTPVTIPSSQAGALAPILSSIELQIEHYRYIHRAGRGTTFEVVFPFWVRGAIRSDLSRRMGVDMSSVSDARIAAWFAERGANPQFVYNWQAITGAAGSFTEWPTTVKFLLYSAGTWVRGASDIITMDSLYDSTLLGQNDYTALFTEEAWFVAKRGHDSRVVSVPLSADGATHIGVDIKHDGTL